MERLFMLDFSTTVAIDDMIVKSQLIYQPKPFFRHSFLIYQPKPFLRHSFLNLGGFIWSCWGWERL